MRSDQVLTQSTARINAHGGFNVWRSQGDDGLNTNTGTRDRADGDKALGEDRELLGPDYTSKKHVTAPKAQTILDKY